MDLRRYPCLPLADKATWARGLAGLVSWAAFHIVAGTSMRHELRGTDDRTLDRAVGHIEGTAQPGADGNTGIAGHRDGFFRGLKDIAPGDAIELDTLQGTVLYRVERTWVVDPADVSVLDPTATRTLTLVTCVPFYHVGPAPQRFIVRAARLGDQPAFSPPSISRVPSLSCVSSRPGAVFWPLRLVM